MIYCTNDFIRQKALECARGKYQRNLIRGNQRVSGSDINSKWAAGYYNSRMALLDRLLGSGLYVDDVSVGNRRFWILAGSCEAAESVQDDDLLDIWI